MTDKRDLMRKVRARLYDWGDHFEEIKSAGYGPASLEYRLMSEGTDGARSTGVRGHGAVLAAVIRQCDRLSVHNAVRSLPTEQGRVLVWTYADRHSVREIAEHLNESRGTVHRRLTIAQFGVANYLYPDELLGVDADFGTV